MQSSLKISERNSFSEVETMLCLLFEYRFVVSTTLGAPKEDLCKKGQEPIYYKNI